MTDQAIRGNPLGWAVVANDVRNIRVLSACEAPAPAETDHDLAPHG